MEKHEQRLLTCWRVQLVPYHKEYDEDNSKKGTASCSLKQKRPAAPFCQRGASSPDTSSLQEKLSPVLYLFLGHEGLLIVNYSMKLLQGDEQLQPWTSVNHAEAAAKLVS